MATQGHISRPGAWSFPDCLELGVPGFGSLTWQESQSVLALFAITSSPLLLGNDARPGRMQQRLVDLLTNPDLIAVDQYYSDAEAFAGGRIWSGPTGKEVWGKPLRRGVAAVVLVNRFGSAIGNFEDPLKPNGGLPAAFAPFPGCFITDGDPLKAPCDENVTSTTGAQEVSIDFASTVPRSWLGFDDDGDAAHNRKGHRSVSCDVFDILAAPNAGRPLGRYDGKWAATIPPHGARFLRLENCTSTFV